MAALFSELSNPCANMNIGNSLDDKRTLELALELSMLNLNDPNIGLESLMQHQQQQHQQQQQQQQQQQHQQSSGLMDSITNPLSAFSSLMCNGVEERTKKSQNMTECVPVPSSEHVAEIVGRQGCKIKALRAKTNTYIKTPVRGEEPVFVVTGRKEDVAKAKREILSAADHFSLIRAARKPTANGLGKGSLPGPPANIPGQVTIQVRVPYRVVGLVVGPKGATIKHIQQQTQTYIVTPSRDKEPVFEVTGLPDNVQTAKRQIEAHIALRTGTVANGNSGAAATLNGLLTDDAAPEILASLYKNGFNSIFGYLDPPQPNTGNVVQEFANTTVNSTGSSTCSSSSSSSTSSKSAMMIRPELMNIWKSFGSESLEVDEGIGESPSNIWPVQNATNSVLGSRSSPSVSTSPTDSLLNGGGGSVKRDCLMCGEKEINSALVPCGHSMFCVECANRISTSDSSCPVCSQNVVQAIRIIA